LVNKVPISVKMATQKPTGFLQNYTGIVTFM
jgi:hypothetical protein